MASFAEIMQGMQPQQSQLPYVPGAPMQGQPLPYVPGMPESNAMPMAPAPVPMQQQAPVTAPPQAAPQGQVPPEELAQRQADWKQVLNGLMQQPNAQQIMLSVGLKLLQGRKPGQSYGQQFGAALGTGAAANAMLDANAKGDAEKARKQQMEEQRFGVDMRARTAEAGKAEYDLDFARKTEPEKRQKIELELGNLRRQGRLDEARAVAAELQNGNFDAAWELTQRKANAEIANAAYNARTNRMNAERSPSATATQDRMSAIIRRANPIKPGETPEAYDQRIAELEYNSSFTGKSTSVKDTVAQITALTKVMENADDAQVPGLQAQIDALTASLPGVQPQAAASTALPKDKSGQKADWIARAIKLNPTTPIAEVRKQADKKFGNQ